MNKTTAVITIVTFVLSFSGSIAVIWVAIHFIRKFW